METGLYQMTILRVVSDGGVWTTTSPVGAERDIERAACAIVESQLVNDSEVPSRDDICLVEKERGRWCRARVVNLLKSLSHGIVAELFLIDSGETVSKPLTDLLCLNEEDDLLLAPPLAQKCMLASIRPVGAYKPSWASQVMECLCSAGGHTYEGGGVSVLALDTDDGVELWNKWSDGTGIVNLNAALVDAGLYTKTSSTTTPSPPKQHKSPSKQPPPLLDDSDDSLLQSSLIPDSQSSSGTSYKSVFTMTSKKLNPHCSLNEPRFHRSLCSILKERGFVNPTAVQGCSWPYLLDHSDCMMVSPHKTGKTLAYLLPLITLIAEELDSSYEPNLVVLVSTSFKAWLVSSQISILLSSISAEKRFRVCDLYNGTESNAIKQLMNGVDVIVVTPPALIRMMKKSHLSLEKLRHLVLDDAEILLELFPSDVATVVQLYDAVVAWRERKGHPPCRHLVATATHYSPLLMSAVNTWWRDPIVIINGSDELLISKKVSLQVHHVMEDQLAHTAASMLVGLTEKHQWAEEGPVLVCAGSRAQALSLVKLLKLRCVSVQLYSSRPQSAKVSVLCDEDLHHCLPSTHCYTTMVHYSLPNDKSVFSHRIAMLHPSLVAGKRCRVVVLTTDRNKEQSVWLEQLLSKMKLDCPADLRHLAEQKNVETCHHPELCTQLKTRGECRWGSRCHYAHSIIQLSHNTILPPLDMPTSGVIKVKVRYVSSPSQLWVSVMEHVPLRQGDPSRACHHDGSTTASQLAMDMALHYSTPGEHGLEAKPSIGDYCAIMDNDGCYRRVIVLAFSQPLGLYFHHTERARVRLVDIGRDEVVEVSRLLSLPHHLLAVAPLVVEMIVCGIVPCDHDMDWAPPAVNMSRHMFNGKVLTGKVVLTVDQAIWVDPVEERMELGCVGVTTGLRSPQQALVKAGQAVRNQTHLPDLADHLDVILNHHDSHADVATMSWNKLNSRDTVVISSFRSPSLFYVQLVSGHKQLYELTDRLNDESINHSLLVSVCHPVFDEGDMCAAKFSLDQLYYRAVVRTRNDHADGRKYECFFVDFGNTEIMSERSLLPISPLMLETPFQAIECSLHNGKNVSCDGNADVAEQLQGTVFTASVHSETASSNGDTQCYTVDLVTIMNNTSLQSLISIHDDESSSTDLLAQELLATARRFQTAVSNLSFSTTSQDALKAAHQIMNCVLTAPKRVDTTSLSDLLKLLPLACFITECSPIVLRALCLLSVLNNSEFLKFIYSTRFCSVMLQLLKTAQGDSLLKTVQLIQLTILHDGGVFTNEETLPLYLLYHAAHSADFQIAVHCLESVSLLLPTTSKVPSIDVVLPCIKRSQSHKILVTPVLKLVYHLIESSSVYHESAMQLVSICTDNELVKLVQFRLKLHSRATVKASSPSQRMPQQQPTTPSYSRSMNNRSSPMKKQSLDATIKTSIPSPRMPQQQSTTPSYSRSMNNRSSPMEKDATIKTSTPSPRMPQQQSTTPSYSRSMNNRSSPMEKDATIKTSTPSPRMPQQQSTTSRSMNNRWSPMEKDATIKTSTPSPRMPYASPSYTRSAIDSRSPTERQPTISSHATIKTSTPSPCMPQQQSTVSSYTRSAIDHWFPTERAPSSLDSSFDSSMSETPVQTRQSLSPQVLWSQTRSMVVLSVQLRDCCAPHVQYTGNTISFIGYAQQVLYEFSVDLFGGILPKECIVKHGGGEVLIKMKKAHRAFWPRVTKAKIKHTFMSVDYNRWKDESSCSSSEDEKMVVKSVLSKKELQKAQAGGAEPSPSLSSDNQSYLSSEGAFVSDMSDGIL